MNAATSRDLILGAFWRDRMDCEPFLQSLRACNYAGDVVFATHENSPSRIHELHQRGVRTFPLRTFAHRVHPGGDYFRGEALKPLRTMVAPVSRFLPKHLQSRTVELFYHRVFGRFAAWRRFLEKHSSSYDRVLLTDVRDVFFQRDLFQQPFDQHLHVVQEPDKMRLRDDPANAEWLQLAGGADALARFGDCPISCAGTTYGTTRRVLEYLDKMIEHMNSALAELATHRDGDQGVHNFLLRSGQLPQARLELSFQSHVLTMHWLDSGELRWNDRNQIVNHDGSVISLLHQYDRRADVKERVIAQLA